MNDLEVIEAAIARIADRTSFHTCIAILFATDDANQAIRLKDQYESFTCKDGKPNWWNHYLPLVQERINALKEFHAHLSQGL